MDSEQTEICYRYDTDQDLAYDDADRLVQITDTKSGTTLEWQSYEHDQDSQRVDRLPVRWVVNRPGFDGDSIR